MDNFRSEHALGNCLQGSKQHFLYPLKLALASLTGGDRSIGIVRLRTKTTEWVGVHHTPSITTHLDWLFIRQVSTSKTSSSGCVNFYVKNQILAQIYRLFIWLVDVPVNTTRKNVITIFFNIS
jgi:hypothetical protein